MSGDFLSPSVMSFKIGRRSLRDLSLVLSGVQVYFLQYFVPGLESTHLDFQLLCLGLSLLDLIIKIHLAFFSVSSLFLEILDVLSKLLFSRGFSVLISPSKNLFLLPDHLFVSGQPYIVYWLGLGLFLDFQVTLFLELSRCFSGVYFCSRDR